MLHTLHKLCRCSLSHNQVHTGMELLEGRCNYWHHTRRSVRRCTNDKRAGFIRGQVRKAVLHLMFDIEDLLSSFDVHTTGICEANIPSCSIK